MSAYKPAKPDNPRRRTISLNKTSVVINCYDLLPQTPLSTILWTTGLSLLHSSITINNREYAYGSHSTPNLTGVYITAPHAPPPGCLHRLSFTHGFTILSSQEIETVIKDAARQFLGTDWNLLSRNCNHFTSFLCEELTGQKAPGWLNRASRVGGRVPCLVPSLVGVPSADEEGAIGDVESEDGEESDEEAHMLGRYRSRESAGGGRRGSFLVEGDEEAQAEARRRDDNEFSSEDDDDDERRDAYADTLRPPVERRASERPPIEWTSSRQSAERLRRKFASRRSLRDRDGRVVPVSERAPAP